MPSHELLVAFFQGRLITLAGNSLAVRVAWQAEADRGISIGGQAFKACGKLQQIAPNVC